MAYIDMPWWGEENPVGSRLLGALGNIVFSDGNPEKQAIDITTQIIKEAWAKGNLPQKDGKQWIVGYRVYKTFLSGYVTPIKCGPARPSKFRDRYVICEVRKR